MQGEFSVYAQGGLYAGKYLPKDGWPPYSNNLKKLFQGQPLNSRFFKLEG